MQGARARLAHHQWPRHVVSSVRRSACAGADLREAAGELAESLMECMSFDYQAVYVRHSSNFQGCHAQWPTSIRKWLP
eukprot:s1560_g5.t1